MSAATGGRFTISLPVPPIGAPEYSQGIELDTSTVGYSNINFSFDWYSTTQGVRDLQFQYNLNTSNSAGWTNIGTANGIMPPGTVPDGPGSQNYVFVATPNDFYGGANPQTITVNLSTLTAAGNDPNFGVRLVSAFDDTGHYNDYVSATENQGQTQLYNNSSGNWRLGNLTFSGSLGLNTSFTGPTLTWNAGSGTWNSDPGNKVWLLSGGSSAYSDSNIYNCTFGSVSSGTSTITVAPGGVAPTGVTINNTTPGTGYSFVGGAISGTGAMYLPSTNAGFVWLSLANSYSGGTQVSGGTLIVSGDASLGAFTPNTAGALLSSITAPCSSLRRIYRRAGCSKSAATGAC